MLDAGKPGSRPRMITALLGVVKNNASSPLISGRCHRIENGADVGGEGGEPAAGSRAQIIHGVEQASRAEARRCRRRSRTRGVERGRRSFGERDADDGFGGLDCVFGRACWCRRWRTASLTAGRNRCSTSPIESQYDRLALADEVRRLTCCNGGNDHLMRAGEIDAAAGGEQAGGSRLRRQAADQAGRGQREQFRALVLLLAAQSRRARSSPPSASSPQ